jgi:hypothetical protein
MKKLARNKLARFNIASELLREFLHLPEGTNIIDISRDFTRYDEFIVIVENDDFKELLPSETLPQARPIYRTTTNDRGEVIKTELETWGLS